MTMNSIKPLNPSNRYHIDESGRIRPVQTWNWIVERWKDCPTFEVAIASISSSSVFQEDVMSPPPWNGVTPEEWEDIVAHRYLDIEDGFYLATGLDVRRGLRAFYWGEEVFFAIRPDFGYRTLVTDFEEPCINAAESAVRDWMLEFNRQAVALHRAIQSNELDPSKLYPVEWWQEFWKLRQLNVVPLSQSAKTISWPWGSHETELLRAFAEAGKKFWSNYDPVEKDTAPTNEAVTNWLIGKGVAKRVAEVMAQILRADGLPTGPRK